VCELRFVIRVDGYGVWIRMDDMGRMGGDEAVGQDGSRARDRRGGL